MELRTNPVHPSEFESACTHVLIGQETKVSPESVGPGSEDQMRGGTRVWQDFANCSKIKQFSDTQKDPKLVACAQQVCRSCDSRSACLDFARRNGIDSGVWGAQDFSNRAAVIRTSRLGLSRAAGVHI